MKKSPRRKKLSPKLSMAQKADKHQLYEQAVQCPQTEIDFISRIFKKVRGRPARRLREDFCGSAAVCCEWLQRHSDNTALGVDIDPKILQWAQDNNVPKLSKNQRERLRLLNKNVLEIKTIQSGENLETVARNEAVLADVILAMNFSYWLFMERADLLLYFRQVRRGLAADGIFFLDIYGGHESHAEQEEERECEGFTYIWEQAQYNPIQGCLTCYIHFRFPDKSSIRRAFKYRWRLWSLPEIQDLLREAGFSDITVYWEGTDSRTGEGNGIFRPSTRGDADPAWVAYISAHC